MRWIAVLVALAAPAVVATGAGAQERDDYLLVMDARAGPYRYLESVTRDCCTAYADALEAFGTPTHFRREANLCLVTWRHRGLKVAFAGRGCSAGALRSSAWYGLRLFGRRWHNVKGVRIGQQLAGVRRIYPHAAWEPKGGPQKQPWLVLQRRVVNELRFVALAAQFNRFGRVAVIHVPAAYVY
jgi:hypothetical protein